MNISQETRNIVEEMDRMQNAAVRIAEIAQEIKDIDEGKSQEFDISELQKNREKLETEFSNLSEYMQEACEYVVQAGADFIDVFAQKKAAIEAQAKEYRALAAKNTAKAKRQDQALEYFERLASQLVDKMGGRIDTPEGRAAYYKESERLFIPDNFDLTKLRSDFVKIELSPKKTEIKKAIKDGSENGALEVMGIKIEKTRSLIIK